MMDTKTRTLLAVAIMALAACGADRGDEPAAEQTVELDKTAPEVTFKPKGDFENTVVKPGAPYSIGYRIIGTPVVGSPVTIDLRVDSAMGPRPVTIKYRINDASSMSFAASQPDRVYMEPAANEASFTQQVTVIPQRDGRYYLNVNASFETEDGTMSTAAAIPIQVGSGTRELQENGTVEVDESGEPVRVLSND